MIDTGTILFPAAEGEEERTYYVYVPEEDPDDPDRHYPVLYMFDGHNVFFDEDATYGKSWGMGEYLEETGAPLIVAAVECNHHEPCGRIREYSPYDFSHRMFGGLVRGYGQVTMDWYTGVFKPFVDENYPTLPDREDTFIGGSSMGGLMSLFAICRYNHVFSRAAVLSPSIAFGVPDMDDMINGGYMAPDTVIYMDFGERELGWHRKMPGRWRAVNNMLLRKGALLTSRIVPGGEHCEASWERQLPFAIPTLLFREEDPTDGDTL